MDAMEALEELAEWLRTTREGRENSSKAEAARLADVSRMTYDMWERGVWVPDPDKAETLAKITDRSVNEVRRLLLRANDIPIPESTGESNGDAAAVASEAGIPEDVYERWKKLKPSQREQVAAVVRSVLDTMNV